jgi:hypothetical protein
MNPLQIDTVHKVACALICWNVIDIPEGANDEFHYGRYLLMDASSLRSKHYAVRDERPIVLRPNAVSARDLLPRCARCVRQEV